MPKAKKLGKKVEKKSHTLKSVLSTLILFSALYDCIRKKTNKLFADYDYYLLIN